MAKSKSTLWGLRIGHPNPFRRTVTVGKGKSEERVTLVFEPGTPYELSDSEVAQLKEDIDNGMIVPWEEDRDDFRQRLRPGGKPEPKPTEKPEGGEQPANEGNDQGTATVE